MTKCSYAARSPRRGLLSIAVGEEDEGRRTYGTRSCTAMRPRRGRISTDAHIAPVGVDDHQSTSLLFYRHPMGVPFGGVPFGIGHSVGSSGCALLAHGYSDSPPLGTSQPTRKCTNDRFGVNVAHSLGGDGARNFSTFGVRSAFRCCAGPLPEGVKSVLKSGQSGAFGRRDVYILK